MLRIMHGFGVASLPDGVLCADSWASYGCRHFLAVDLRGTIEFGPEPDRLLPE